MTSKADLIALAYRLPKAELDIRIEGSLEPDLMLTLARRNHIELPFRSIEAARAAYNFSNRQGLLDIHDKGLEVLRTVEDFFDLTMAYLNRARADNVRHAEVSFEPQTHTRRGVAFDTPMRGILTALSLAKPKFGMSASLILCFVRHLSEEDAARTLDDAGPWIGQIAGVGLDSSEHGHPPSRFAQVFAAARAQGLKCVAHAGAEGPPAYITEALDLLRVDRLDPGNRALEDDALITRLRESNIPLTVCPLANDKIRDVKDRANNPLKRMLDLGLRATINSGDPAYSGGNMQANFATAIEALDLTADDIRTLARNSFKGAFLTEGQIRAHVAAVDAVR